MHRLTRFEHWHRDNEGQANKSITLSFSDGSSQWFRLSIANHICRFDIVPVETSFVNITVTEGYGTIIK